MSKERELLQNILDQHEDDRFDIGSINHGKIRRLLAQPEQEPLSDDEIDILWGNEKAIGLYSFARVIEKHHGITGADSE